MARTGPRVGVAATLGLLGLLGARPATGFAPSEHELQRSGLELADGGGLGHGRVLVGRPPKSRGPAWRRFRSAYPGTAWRSQWDVATGIPVRVYGRGPAAPGACAGADRAAAAARAMLERHLGLFAPGAEPADLELVTNHFDPTTGLRTVGFQQRFAGREVRGGQLSVRIKRDRVVVIASDAVPVDAVPPPPQVHLPAGDLAWIARDWMAPELPAGGALAVERGASEAFLLTLPRREAPPERVWVREVVLRTERPASRWSVYLDARSGAPVAREQTLRFFRGRFRLSVPDRYPARGRRVVPARNLDLDAGGLRTRTALSGDFGWSGAPTTTVQLTAVEGAKVVVEDRGGAPFALQWAVTDSATVTADLSSIPAEDAQLAAYHAADLAARFVEGIDRDNRFARAGRVPTHVNLDGGCNAFSDGVGIHFLRGDDRCENTARLFDVVVHEYGHAVHAQSILPGVGRFDAALSEGLADYLAATMVDDSGMGRGFFRDDQALRDLDRKSTRLNSSHYS